MRAVMGIALVVAGALAAARYHKVERIEVGGAGSWDYLTVDTEGHRLFVSHGTYVAVADLNTRKVAAEIDDTQGVHGIALAPALGRGFISCGRSNDVLIFDLKTLKPLGRTPAGQNPDSIVFDPASGRVFTFNGRSKDATALDAATGKATATLPLNGKPEFSVADGRGKIWVNIEDSAEIVELNTRKLGVSRRYKLPGCEEPSGLALDPQKMRLFSVCGNSVMAVSDIASGKVVATVPIGDGSDGVVFDAERRMAFSSNGAGSITVVAEDGAGYRVAATVPTERGARTVALDPSTHRLYTPTARFGPMPPATTERPQPRPVALPGSFHVLVVGE